MTHEYDWWLTPSVALGIHIIQLEARIEKARWNGNALVFRFPLLFRLGIVLFTPFVTYLLIRDWKGEDWLVRVLGLVIALCLLLGWPPTIVLTSAGIERHFWWKRRIFIPWNQVVDVEIARGGDIRVIGASASIFFSRFQNDAMRFKSELRAHTKLRKFSSPEQVIGLHL